MSLWKRLRRTNQMKIATQALYSGQKTVQMNRRRLTTCLVRLSLKTWRLFYRIFVRMVLVNAFGGTFYRIQSALLTYYYLWA